MYYTQDSVRNLRLVYQTKQSLVNTYIYPTPPDKQDVTEGQSFKWSLTGLNLEFPFS